MHFTPLFRSSSVAISSIACRPQCMARGGAEAQPYHSLAFVRRGAYRFHQGAQSVIVEPLSAVFFAAGDEYSVSHPFGRGDDCLELRFAEEVLDEARPAFRNAGEASKRANILSINPCDGWRVSVMARRAETGAASQLETAEAAFDILARTAAAETKGGDFGSVRAGGANSVSQRKVERAKEFLISDVARDWSLAEVAKDAGVSPFHLTRLFRVHTGATLHQYLNRQRLCVALDRVLSGEDDLTGLALDVGFSSHSHFTAAFRRQYGRPPRAVRAIGADVREG